MRTRILTATVVVLLYPLLRSDAWAKPYANTPEIIALLADLGESAAVQLPHDPKNSGRRSNDYSMRMAYAPERRTAMYAGGNHNNGRRNDCWEYHLGSNTWHQLYPAEGDDHYFLKNIVMYRMRAFKHKTKRRTNTSLDDFIATLEQKDRVTLKEKVIPWWRENVVLRDGLIQTRGGGPVMPSHTWDGLTYDPVNRRMLWSAGAGPNGECYGFHRLIHGMSDSEMAAQRSKQATLMWAFDAAAGKWRCYDKPENGACPDFRGMGQSLVYLPDRRAFIWYVAAANVSPHSFQMWNFDPAGDRWTRLAPNDGASISELVNKRKVAPPGEQVIRYSPKQKKLYAFQGPTVYSYDVTANVWAVVGSDARIDAHDAHTAIAYDSVNDVFIYSRKEVRDAQIRLGIFSPETNAWEVPVVSGAPLPSPKWGKLKAYFDPVHNVYVVAAGGPTPAWVYRYRKRQ